MHCLNIVIPYNDPEGRRVQCSICKRRRTVRLQDFQQAVNKSRELPAPWGVLGAIPRIRDRPGPLESIIRVLGDTVEYIGEGLQDFRKIIAVREEMRSSPDITDAIARVRERLSEP